MVITPIVSLFTTFGRKGWLKNYIKSSCWRLKGRRQILKRKGGEKLLQITLMDSEGAKTYV